MTFTSPVWLWALLVLPVVLLLEWRAVRKAMNAAAALVGARSGHPQLAQAMPWSRRVGLALRGGALGLLVVGAAGPQWGRETVRRESRGSDVVFVLDVSASMDVRDVVPTRMDEARREALGLLERIPGSRVGVVLFAGDAVRVCPLTLDHSAVRMMLESVNTASLSEPGTDLGAALRQALAALPDGRHDDQGLVLWTDGEDLEGHARAELEHVKNSGVRVFAVGVGTPAGDVVPEFDEQGRATDVKRDLQGNVVRSRLDDRTLREMARSTHGSYFAAARAGGELQRLAGMVGTLAQVRRGARLVERPVARFMWFALAASALLSWDFARSRRRVQARRRAAARGGARVAATASALVLLACGSRETAAQSAWAKGDAAFRSSRWSAAESLYARRVTSGGPSKLRVNLATAQAMNGKGEAAELALSRLAGDSAAAGRAAGYNLGTLLGKRREFERALQELRRVLERDPSDSDARWNYEMVKRLRDQAKASSSPQSQPQDPQAAQPSAGGGKQPQPKAGSPPPTPQPQQNPAAPDMGPGGAAGMTRQQAEALLGSLQELERIERQRAQRARGGRDRRGKDW